MPTETQVERFGYKGAAQDHNEEVRFFLHV